MTATAVSNEDGYHTEAVAELVYPTARNHAQAPHILLSVASLGPIPEEPLANRRASATSGVVHHREYVYHECPYDVGATEGTGPEGHEKGMPPEIEEPRDLKLLVKKATQEFAERGPVRDCPNNGNSFHWRYVVGITGYITYKSGDWIEPEGEPECYAVGTPEAEQEDSEDREKEEETGKKIERHITNYKPFRQEGCFNKTNYATRATNGFIVIGRWVWHPGGRIDYYVGGWYEKESACGLLRGHIPIEVPNEEEEYGETIFHKEQCFYFKSGTKHNEEQEPKPCDWAHPQNPLILVHEN